MAETIRPVGDVEKAAKAVGFGIDSAAQKTPAGITNAVAQRYEGVVSLVNYRYLEGLRDALKFVLGGNVEMVDILLEQYKFAVRPPFEQQVDSGEVAGADPLGR